MKSLNDLLWDDIIGGDSEEDDDDNIITPSGLGNISCLEMCCGGSRPGGCGCQSFNSGCF